VSIVIEWVQKWGSKLTTQFHKLLVMQDGSALRSHSQPSRELTLDSLLAEVTEDNLHEAIEETDGVGLERW